MEMMEIKQLADRVKANVQKVIVGKGEIIDYVMIAFICGGHVLLEDVPGTGKTLMAKAMAQSLKCKSRRIQFTPDLLPADVTGIHFYNQKLGEFEFREGAIFSNIVLADEINRATPRTQSSLLECMEERQATIDGQTHRLDAPFLVIATQNPLESQGTFPLPDAQLDRFLLKVKMGYPTKAEGIDILKRFKSGDSLETIASVATKEMIVQAQKAYVDVHISDAIFEYILDIVEKTRHYDGIELGVSPRGSQALLKATQVYAILRGREYVIPDDVKALVKPVLAHRLVLNQMMGMKDGQAEKLLDQIMAEVPVPTEEIYV